MSRRLKSSLLIVTAILIAVAVIPSVHAAITFGTSTDFNGATTASIAVTSGQLIIVEAIEAQSSTTPTVSDTVNTYTSVTSKADAGIPSGLFIFQAKAASTATLTLTMTFGAGAKDAVVYTYNGVNTIGATNAQETSSTTASLSITTTVAGSTIVGTATNLNTNTPPTVSAPQVSRITSFNRGGFNPSGEVDDRVVTAIQSYSDTWSGIEGAGVSDYQAMFELTLPPPAITGISPTSGTNGASITITGTNLNGVTKITVCGDNQPVFTLVSSTSITTFAPNRNPTGTGETCDILVTNSVGTSATVTADQFTYNPASTQGGYAGPPGIPASFYFYVSVIGIFATLAVTVALVKGRRKQ